MTDEENAGKIEIESTVEPGPWRAEWSVYGPFEKAKKFNPSIYWKWKVKFTNPAGETLTWYRGDMWMISRDCLDGESPTREQAVEDAVAKANNTLVAERRNKEPVESGVITLPSTVS